MQKDTTSSHNSTKPFVVGIPNRSIKFRAWDSRYNKMHYKLCVGNLDDDENYTAHSVYLRPGDTDYKIEAPGQWMNFDEHSDYTLMQFTGMLDRKGNEIYEGDILTFDAYEWNRSSWKSKEEWEYPKWLVQWDELSASWDLGGGTSSETPTYKEVIGNVFQNPELLG